MRPPLRLAVLPCDLSPNTSVILESHKVIFVTGRHRIILTALHRAKAAFADAARPTALNAGRFPKQHQICHGLRLEMAF
jgi:hypothetical protein